MSRKGIIPKVENATQTMAVSRKPSRVPISRLRGLMPKAISDPTVRQPAAGQRNALTSGSFQARAVSSGASMKIPSMMTSHPMNRATMAKFMFRRRVSI